MPFITVRKENSKDIELHYRDWGKGQPVVFSLGLSAGSGVGFVGHDVGTWIA